MGGRWGSWPQSSFLPPVNRGSQPEDLGVESRQGPSSPAWQGLVNWVTSTPYSAFRCLKFSSPMSTRPGTPGDPGASQILGL